MIHPGRRPGPPDEGSALVEFVGAAVILLLPLGYLLLAVFAIQRAAFAVSDGARNAGRALTVAGSTAPGLGQARIAAELALADQGVAGAAELRYTSGSCAAAPVTPTLTPGAHYTVCLRVRVPLPFTGDRLLGRIAPAAVTVLGSYLLIVDPYRAAR